MTFKLSTHLGAHRCQQCRMLLSLCVCDIAPKLSISTQVFMLLHCGEWLKASNTGHFAQLALDQADIRLHGQPHQPLDTSGFDSPSNQRVNLLLYPGLGAKPLDSVLESLPPESKFNLLIPDGNWSQARRMILRNPVLNQAIRVELRGPRLDLARPRRNIYPDRMSTFEAMAQALGHMEGVATEDSLLDFFKEVVARMQVMRGCKPPTYLSTSIPPSH